MPSIDIEIPAEKLENKEENSAPATLPVIGIIYPPPEVRSILFNQETVILLLDLIHGVWNESFALMSVCLVHSLSLPESVPCNFWSTCMGVSRFLDWCP